MKIALIVTVVVLVVMFATIPKRDWGVVSLYMAMCGAVFYGCMMIFPDPYHIMAFAWIVIGQAVLVKEKVLLPYPKTLSGSILTFGMAIIWPKYCFRKS